MSMIEYGSQFFVVKSKDDTGYTEEEEEIPEDYTTAYSSSAPRARSTYGPDEIKIVIAGSGGVGKSAYTVSLVQNHFVSEYDPTIEDSYRKQVSVDGRSVMLDILDTAGQEEYSSMRDQYIRTGNLFLVVYSITSRSSFDEVRQMIQQIQHIKDTDRVAFAILGNKCDLDGSDRQVSEREGRELAAEYKCPFFETSAKTHVNIEESMFAAIRFFWAVTGGVASSSSSSSAASTTKKGSSFISKLFGSKTTTPSTPPPPTTASKKKTRVVRYKNASTNVVMLSMGTLSEECELATGDPLFCGTCGAALCAACKVSSGVWACVICGDKNNAPNLEPEEMPKTDTVDYILAAAPSLSTSNNEPHVVVFMVDISGSMCVTSDIPALQAEWARLRSGGGGGGGGAAGGNNYITRLQCVKAAVDAHLERLVRQSPDTRVMLMTFNNCVTIYGDGTAEDDVTVVTGDTLGSSEKLAVIGEAIDVTKLKPIRQSREALSKVVSSLEEEGATSLGPCLALGVACCSRLTSRSEIFIMTDGLSNVGVGALDGDEAIKQAAAEFFRVQGERALQTNTTISVIGIENADSGNGQLTTFSRCDVALDVLGKCADTTHGTITIVNPFELLRQIRAISQNPVIATDVKYAVASHPGIEIADQSLRIAGRSGAAAATSAARREKSSAHTTTETAQQGEECCEGEIIKSALEKLKSEMLVKEDYDSAKEIKEQVAVADMLIQKEKEKKEMIDKEMYEQAKAIKQEQEDLKVKITKVNVTELLFKWPKRHQEAQQIINSSKAAAVKAAAEYHDFLAQLPSVTVGNALAEMDLTFEMQPRKSVVESNGAGVPPSVYIQVLVSYTRMNGTKCLRVCSKPWQVTRSRSAAEESANVAIVGLHVLHQAATLGTRHEWNTCKELVDGALKSLRKVAKTEVQVEEYYSLKGKIEQEGMDSAINRSISDTRAANSDTTAKVMYFAKAANKNLLLAGRLKTAAVNRRKVAKEQQEQVHRFGVESKF